MVMHVRDANVWKPVPKLWVKDNGIWKPVQRAFVKDGGVWKQFHQNEVVVVINSHSMAINLQNYFTNADWINPLLTKRVIVNNGAHIWSTDPNVPALNCGSGRQGQLIINIAAGSYILGGPGNRDSGTGGTAIYTRQAVAIDNGGSGIQGGGGGGGHGGQGGPGVWYSGRDYLFSEGRNYVRNSDTWNYYNSGSTVIFWAGVQLTGGSFSGDGNIYYNGGWEYYKNGGAAETFNQSGFVTGYPIARRQTRTAYDVPNYTTGGAGGTGGFGSGWNSSRVDVRENGYGGGGGGTNAGSGGAGGIGGGWGQAGATGATGNAGNNGGGAAGTGGGAAGCYVDGGSYVSWVPAGNLLGRNIN